MMKFFIIMIKEIGAGRDRRLGEDGQFFLDIFNLIRSHTGIQRGAVVE